MIRIQERYRAENKPFGLTSDSWADVEKANLLCDQALSQESRPHAHNSSGGVANIHAKTPRFDFVRDSHIVTLPSSTAILWPSMPGILSDKKAYHVVRYTAPSDGMIT